MQTPSPDPEVEPPASELNKQYLFKISVQYVAPASDDVNPSGHAMQSCGSVVTEPSLNNPGEHGLQS